MNNIIEYDECVYGLNKDMQDYLLQLVKNTLGKESRIIREDIENIQKYIDIIVDLHNNCHLGMVKLSDNEMSGLGVEEI